MFVLIDIVELVERGITVSHWPWGLSKYGVALPMPIVRKGTMANLIYYFTFLCSWDRMTLLCDVQCTFSFCTQSVPEWFSTLFHRLLSTSPDALYARERVWSSNLVDLQTLKKSRAVRVSMWSTDVKLKYKEKRGERVYSVFFFFFFFFPPDVFCIHSSLCKQKKRTLSGAHRRTESRSTLQFAFMLCASDQTWEQRT